MDSRAEQATELREAHTLTEVARRLGVSRATIIRWTVPGAAERDRAHSRNWKIKHPESRVRHEATLAGECSECGRATTRGHKRCGKCSIAAHKAQGAHSRGQIVKLWQQTTLSARQIADTLGTTEGTVLVTLSKLRKTGEDIPYARERRRE